MGPLTSSYEFTGNEHLRTDVSSALTLLLFVLTYGRQRLVGVPKLIALDGGGQLGRRNPARVCRASDKPGKTLELIESPEGAFEIKIDGHV